MTDGTPIKDSAPIPEPPKPAMTPEATAPVKPEVASTKQEVNTALEAVGKQYLEQKDPRIGVVALARLAGEAETTPMGEELRQDVIRTLQSDELTPDAIKNLRVPDKQETGAFEAFLTTHADKFPTEAASQLTLAINSGRLTIGQLAENMQSYTPLREPFFNALLGEHHAELNTTEDMLKAIHIEPNTTHMQQWAETFKSDKLLTTKTGGHFDSTLAIGISMMAVQFGISMFSEQQQAQAQHSMH